MAEPGWRCPPDPFNPSEWIDLLWRYVPSCPCFICEDYRADHGLSCMYGLGPRPDQSPDHNWEGQSMLAGWPIPDFTYPQVDNAHSGGETNRSIEPES